MECYVRDSIDSFVQHASYAQRSSSEPQDVLVQRCALDTVVFILQRHGRKPQGRLMQRCVRDPVDLYLQLRPRVPGQPRAA
eukprot:9156485-Alexandrium_andersonii.AAC.1